MQKQNGVVAFYSAKDIPGSNNFMASLNLIRVVEAEELFCNGEVKYYGQPVGMIVSESFAIANYATQFVKILYEKQGLIDLASIDF